MGFVGAEAQVPSDKLAAFQRRLNGREGVQADGRRANKAASS